MSTKRQAVTRLSLDMKMDAVQKSVAVSLGDTNRRFEIRLTNAGNPFTIPPTWTTTLHSAKLDEGCVVDGGIIVYDLSGGALTEEAGIFEIQFKIFDEEGKEISTPRITCNVYDTERNTQEVASQSEFGVLQDFVKNINDVNERLDDLAEKDITYDDVRELISQEVPAWAMEPDPPEIAEETDPTVPSWAKQPKKPSYSKSEVGLGNVDNVKQYSAANPPPYPVTSVAGKTGAVTLGSGDVGLGNVDNVRQYSKNNPPPYPVTSVAGKTGVVTLKASDVGADASGTASKAVSEHNVSDAAHNDLRVALKDLADRLSAALNSDDTTLDDLKEVVTYIKSNRTLIDAITTSKVNVADIINDLITNVADKPLSAAQGVIIKGLIDDVAQAVKEAVTIGTVSIAPSQWTDGHPLTASVFVNGLVEKSVAFLFPADDETKVEAAASKLSALAYTLIGVGGQWMDIVRAEVDYVPEVTLNFITVVIKDESATAPDRPRVTLVGIDSYGTGEGLTREDVVDIVEETILGGEW